MNQTEKHHLLFAQLVISLHAATMQQLGKLKNPLSGKVERDLPGAQASIDMLDMIREKTRGNLTEEEGRILTQVLHELRLNYVDEVNKESRDAPAGGTGGAAGEAPPPGGAAGGAGEPADGGKDRA